MLSSKLSLTAPHQAMSRFTKHRPGTDLFAGQLPTQSERTRGLTSRVSPDSLVESQQEI